MQSFKPRIEDDRLVRGTGRFVDDVRSAKQVSAFFLRSPHAFAKIRAIKIDAAAAHPGVRAVLTASDIKAAGVGNVSQARMLVGRGGDKLKVPFRPALADGRVMHVGQPVVLIVSESLAAAQEAAELVEVEYEELPSVVGVRAAAADGAAQLWGEASANVAIDWPGPMGDDEANEREVARIIASAPFVARLSLVNQRLVVASMETRGATADFDVRDGTYTLRCCSQGVGAMRGEVAAALGVPAEKIIVVTEDVGGAFGMKTPLYPEYIALLIAARRLGRPVHWMSTRSEAFLSDNQARDTITDAELAVDANGIFLALRANVLADMGAFLSSASAFIATSNFARCLGSVYHVPRIAVGVKCVFTNSLPTAPYRGAGRPEANYAMERLVEAAARLTQVDAIELRRRNMITPLMLPYKTQVGTVIDSGDFAAVLDRALEISDYAGFAERRAEAAKRGKRRGIGISCFLEHSGGTPTETAALAFPGDDAVVLNLGVQGTGQGQATVFSRLAADRLGIAADKLIVRQGDTRLGMMSGGTSTASRSTTAAGSAIVRTAEAVIEKGRRLAATMLETDESDIEYAEGRFVVKGTDRRISLFAVAEHAAAAAGQGAPPELLDTKLDIEVPQTFPNGCHIAEVEIDPETGQIELVSYTSVDDSGNVLDPMLVEGQVHGGVAQGLGQALFEQAVYDHTNGQLITGSFTDYAMPRATDVPSIGGELYSVPAKTNPLGAKGAGESGTTGSLAAVMNAVADAIPTQAGLAMDMPATPAKIWRALRDIKCQGREEAKVAEE